MLCGVKFQAFEMSFFLWKKTAFRGWNLVKWVTGYQRLVLLVVYLHVLFNQKFNTVIIRVCWWGHWDMIVVKLGMYSVLSFEILFTWAEHGFAKFRLKLYEDFAFLEFHCSFVARSPMVLLLTPLLIACSWTALILRWQTTRLIYSDATKLSTGCVKRAVASTTAAMNSMTAKVVAVIATGYFVSVLCGKQTSLSCLTNILWQKRAAKCLVIVLQAQNVRNSWHLSLNTLQCIFFRAMIDAWLM